MGTALYQSGADTVAATGSHLGEPLIMDLIVHLSKDSFSSMQASESSSSPTLLRSGPGPGDPVCRRFTDSIAVGRVSQPG